MIVSMPSEEEMATAANTVQQTNDQKSQTETSQDA